ncbi:MAG: class I SAM-dependent RNA methyltransferase [Clostridiales bacterium]|nr:class I SAM-dependent RNA methyltransferase [Clostridiales bacterium]MCF8021883.1 class I SAM-dependent RNA methyltransferase [Clostridiales bacterium]
MGKVELIATSTFGLESVVAKELRELGYNNQQVENGKVHFVANEEAICRTNMWLRTADRVLIKMGEFEAVTFEELFQQTKALPWQLWLPQDAHFPVKGKSVKSTLHSVPDCQAIVKKAVVEKMKETYCRSWFEEKGAAYTIEIALLKDKATLTIDTSGPGLHKRGYRDLSAKAPLKETLAAAIIYLSRWKPERTLIDPMCGSGTIPIEAALIGQNIAPGTMRDFASENWQNIDPLTWSRAREEARDLARTNKALRILGTDIDNKVLKLARHHANKAGVDSAIHFQKQPLSELRSKFNYGYIISNPPYGKRLGEKEQAETLYKEMGKVFKKLSSWSFYILTAHEDFEKIFDRQADKKRKLYNGGIKVNLHQYFGPRPPKDIKIDHTIQ